MRSSPLCGTAQVNSALVSFITYADAVSVAAAIPVGIGNFDFLLLELVLLLKPFLTQFLANATLFRFTVPVRQKRRVCFGVLDAWPGMQRGCFWFSASHFFHSDRLGWLFVAFFWIERELRCSPILPPLLLLFLLLELAGPSGLALLLLEQLFPLPLKVVEVYKANSFHFELVFDRVMLSHEAFMVGSTYV